jgi:acyl carrier protein
MNDSNKKESIRTYLESISGHKPTDVDDLFDKGILDSFGVVDFLTYLEETFQVKVEPEDVTYESLATLNAICDFITRKS